MGRQVLVLFVAAALMLIAPLSARAQPGDARIALVIGNSAYAKGPLPTALNDAGLVAEALRTVGFDIVEGADLSQADMLRSFREFLGKVEAAGPNAVALVYFAGYGFEFEGENLLVAADARLERDTDIPLDTVRLSDILRPLAAAPAQAKVIVLDAARRLPFAIAGVNLAPGLAAVEAPPGMLVAMSAGPGTIAADGQGPYGAYATAIAEMLRAPGLDLAAAFARIRTRTHQLTGGAQTPWHVAALGGPVMLVPPDPATGAAPVVALRAPRPMREIGPDEAYALAIEQDTLPAYVEFVTAYPRHPFAPRIWALIRARREALAWERAVEINTPQAYWTYLRRYPDGIYAPDAERRLRRLAAPFAPPPSFVPVEFVGVPLPLVGEPVSYVLMLPPAPPPPVRLIAPRPAIFVNLPPPPPRAGPRLLPAVAPLPAVPQARPGSIRPPGAPGRIGPPGAALTPAVPGATVPPQPGAVPGRPGLVAPATTAAPSGQPAGAAPGGRLPPGATGRPPQVGNAVPSGSPTGPRPGQPGRLPAATLPPPSGTSPNVAVPPGAPGATRPFGPRGTSATMPGAPAGVAPGAPPGGPPPTVVNRPAVTSPPPSAIGTQRAPSAPAAVNRPLPPAVVNRPPPPAVNRPSPPPPAAVVNRPPPAAINRPPPAAVARPQPGVPPRPPQGAQAPKQGAAKKCEVVNGQQVCR